MSTTTTHRRAALAQGPGARHQRLGRGHPGAGQPLRRRHRRPPVDPRRRRARQGREPLRRPDRPRLPDPVAAHPDVSEVLVVTRHDDGRELRAEQGALPRPGAGRLEGPADRHAQGRRGGRRRPAAHRRRPSSRRGRRASRSASPSRSSASTADPRDCAPGVFLPPLGVLQNSTSTRNTPGAVRGRRPVTQPRTASTVRHAPITDPSGQTFRATVSGGCPPYCCCFPLTPECPRTSPCPATAPSTGPTSPSSASTAATSTTRRPTPTPTSSCSAPRSTAARRTGRAPVRPAGDPDDRLPRRTTARGRAWRCAPTGCATCGSLDAGDVEMYSGDIETALPALEAAVEKVARAGAIPVVLGGDHSIAFADAKGVANVLGHGRVSMIHFDAHADTGDIEFGSLWGHGQPMRRLIESGALRGDRFLQIGLRGYWPPPETLDWMAAQRMRSYEMTEIGHRGLDECLTEAFGIATDECEGVFLSVDIDVCDPGARARHRHARARRPHRPPAARLGAADLPRAARSSASTSSRSARPTTTPTSPRRWRTASSWRRCRPSPGAAGTPATAPAGTPRLPLLADRPTPEDNIRDRPPARPADRRRVPRRRGDPAPRPRRGRALAVRLDRAARAGQGRRPRVHVRRPDPPRGAGDLLEPGRGDAVQGAGLADRRRRPVVGGRARRAGQHDPRRVARGARGAHQGAGRHRGPGQARHHRPRPGAHRHLGVRALAHPGGASRTGGWAGPTSGCARRRTATPTPTRSWACTSSST